MKPEAAPPVSPQNTVAFAWQVTKPTIICRAGLATPSGFTAWIPLREGPLSSYKEVTVAEGSML